MASPVLLPTSTPSNPCVVVFNATPFDSSWNDLVDPGSTKIVVVTSWDLQLEGGFLAYAEIKLGTKVWAVGYMAGPTATNGFVPFVSRGPEEPCKGDLGEKFSLGFRSAGGSSSRLLNGRVRLHIIDPVTRRF